MFPAGVITYSTNTDTSITIREMSSKPGPLRILLETDAPYMVPSNIYSSLTSVKGRLPLCHTAMIPWTAEFVAGVAGEGWDAEQIIDIARENAKAVYGL
jgi:TatD DNase family protein